MGIFVSPIFGIPSLAQTKTEIIDLTVQERLAIYETRKSSAADKVVMNMSPFGIGSWYQGDYLTAIEISICDLVAFAIMVKAIQLMMRPEESYILSDEVLAGPMLFGFAIFPYLLGRILGLIVPWFYSESFNHALRIDLHLTPADIEQRQSVMALPLFSYSARF
jgi:hypothetical protein